MADQLPQADVTEIMRHIREQTSRQRQKFALSSAAASRRNRQVDEDLSLLQSVQDLSQVRFSSHRKVVGDIVVFVKKILQQLLTPILERQSGYNAVNTRLLAYLCERVERPEEQVAAALEALRAKETAFLEALQETVTGQLEALAQQQAAALQALQAEVACQSRGRHAQERHLTLLLDEVRKGLVEQPTGEEQHSAPRQDKSSLDSLCAALTERFRGTREEIKQRLRVYLPHLKEGGIGTDETPVVDLGCGRGEWLELLQEEGIRVKGVEKNSLLVEEGRQSGFEVIESDIVTYLCNLPSGSVGGVTGFHIIEHLPFEAILALFDETIRVLKPGGVAIFETPNPENVLVSTHEFYIDPTHRHPLPSSLVKFIAEAKGLSSVKLLPLHPFPATHWVPEASLEVARRFNELFYGPRDYAVIGWKAPPRIPSL